MRQEYGYNNRDQVSLVRRYADTAGTVLVGQTTLGYDNGGRLTALTHQDGSGATLDAYSYSYDAAHRIVTQTSTFGGSTTYSYDATGQLLSAGTTSYSWDANGNPQGSGYVVTAGNVLAADASWDYVYDAEGNPSQQRHKSTGEEWLYYHDHLNRLVQVERKGLPGGAVTWRVEFGYDVLGNRIQRSVDADGAGLGAAAVEQFACDGVDAWADVTAAGSLTTRRLYQGAVDALFARIGSTGAVDWYLTDHLGSIRDMVDSTGALRDHLEYDPFSTLVSESNPAYGDCYKYTGREYEAEFDAYYHRARYQRSGRWLEQDPLGFTAGERQAGEDKCPHN